MIMATMIEFPQRMLTKRPTVARTSEIGIWLSARSPTRACDPRTEITRPKDVTMNEPDKSNRCCLNTMRASLDKRLSGRRGQFVKSATISLVELVPKTLRCGKYEEMCGESHHSADRRASAVKDLFTKPRAPAMLAAFEKGVRS